MSVHLKMLSGKSLQLSVSHSDSVSDVKSRAAQHLGCRAELILLMHEDGRCLKDAALLDLADVGSCTLQLIKQPCFNLEQTLSQSAGSTTHQVVDGDGHTISSVFVIDDFAGVKAANAEVGIGPENTSRAISCCGRVVSVQDVDEDGIIECLPPSTTTTFWISPSVIRTVDGTAIPFPLRSEYILDGLPSDISSAVECVAGIAEANAPFLSGHADGTIFKWADGMAMPVPPGHAAAITALHLLTAAKPNWYALSASADCTLALWDLNARTLHVKLVGHSMPVMAVIDRNFDNRCWISCASDGLKLWNNIGDCKHTVTEHMHSERQLSMPSALCRLRCLAANFKTASFLSANGEEGQILVWTETMKPCAELSRHGAKVHRLVSLETSDAVASASADGSIKLHRLDRDVLDFNLHFWDDCTNVYPNVGSLVFSVMFPEVSALLLAPSGSTLLAASLTGVCAWRIDLDTDNESLDASAIDERLLIEALSLEGVQTMALCAPSTLALGCLDCKVHLCGLAAFLCARDEANEGS